MPERHLSTSAPPFEVREAIRDLFARYAWSFDTGDVDAYVETFADDGVLDLAGGRYTGRAAIRAYATDVVADPAFVGRQHFITQSLFEPHPSGWTVRSYAFITQRSSNGLSSLFLTGHYRDLCVSVAGQWLLADLVRQHERIDVLINSAGISQNRAWNEIDEDGWDRVFDINLKGLFFLTQAVARHMAAQGGGGSVVSLASIGGKRPGGNLHYGASKAGVISITRSLALALAPHGITVNCVCPGYTLSPLTVRNERELAETGSIPAERTRKRLSEIPLGRYPLPDEVAGLICFLASDEADYMTGQAVNFCGGLHMTS